MVSEHSILPEYFKNIQRNLKFYEELEFKEICMKDSRAITDKTIVLTGSMVPINGFDFSDGPFNLGYAIAKVQVLPKGVYLCMNARVFKPEEVEKDTKRGVFYSVFKEKQ